MSDLFNDLAKILDDNKMQVTFTGWKAELEIAERKVKKLKRLILLVDESVSNEEMNLLSAKQWQSFIKEFPDEA